VLRFSHPGNGHDGVLEANISHNHSYSHYTLQYTTSCSAVLPGEMKKDVPADFFPSQTLKFRKKIQVSLAGDWKLNRL
jgi:hypothetical protein